jgi:cytoskeletal protein RodZ
MKKNGKAKKNNGHVVLSVMMAFSISAAAFFGYMSYSVDQRLNIPVIDTLIGSGSTGSTGTSSSKTTSKTTSKSSSSSKSGSGSSTSSMLMQLGK